MDAWPESAADHLNLRDRVLSNPLCRNRVISSDGEVTTIAVELDQFSGDGQVSVDDALAFIDEAEPDPSNRRRLTDEETQKSLAAIGGIVEDHNSEGFTI